MNAATTDACLELLDSAGLRASVLESLLRAVQLHLDRRACGAFRVGAGAVFQPARPTGSHRHCRTTAERMEGALRWVHFVGAGPGAPDLITRRGAALLQEADCIIYAGSLVNPALLGLAKPGVRRLQQRRDDVGTGAGRDAPGGSRRRDHRAAPHRRPLPVWGHPGADGRTGCGRHPLR